MTEVRGLDIGHTAICVRIVTQFQSLITHILSKEKERRQANDNTSAFSIICRLLYCSLLLL